MSLFFTTSESIGLTSTAPRLGVMKPTEGVTAEIVVQHVRALIERGELRPGDRLPPERELAVQLGVSRPSVRAGLRSLAAIGVLQTRHGAGHVHHRRSAHARQRAAQLPRRAARLHARRDVRGAPRARSRRRRPGRRARQRRADRHDRRRSHRHVRVARRRPDVPDSRHPLPPRGGGRIGQSRFSPRSSRWSRRSSTSSAARPSATAAI